MQILGLYCFVSEAFSYNVANYISSFIRYVKTVGQMEANFFSNFITKSEKLLIEEGRLIAEYIIKD